MNVAERKEKRKSTFERAKSGRAACRECGGKIDEGELRFGRIDFTHSRKGSYRWFHLPCAVRRIPRTVARTLEQQGDALPVPRSEVEAALAEAETAEPELPTDDTPEAAAFRAFDHWARAGAPLAGRKAFRELREVFTDDHALKLEPYIVRWLRARKYDPAEWCLELLAQHGTPTALNVLQGLSQRYAYKGSRNLPAEYFAKLARERGVDREALKDEAVPTGGLDEDGSLVFDYGPRRFELHFDANLDAVLRDEDGERHPRLPRPRKDDDPAKIKAARAEWARVKKEVVRLLKVQSRRLEQSMIDRRGWSPAEFREHVTGHPLMRLLASRVLWSRHGRKGKLVACFRVDESGEPMNAALEQQELGEKEVIRVAHPIDLYESERQKWNEIFDDFEIVAPFVQLARRVHALDPNDPNVGVKDLPEVSVPPKVLHGVLNDGGWRKGKPQDGLIDHFYRRFAGDKITAVLRLDPGIDPAGRIRSHQRIAEVYFVKNIRRDERVRVGAAAPLAFTEALHAVHRLAEASSPEPKPS
jgi:hypothetical protein